MAAAAEYHALAEWRAAIRYAVVGLTVSGDGKFDAELIEDPFTSRLSVCDCNLV